METRLDRIKWTYADMDIRPMQRGKVSLFELGDNVMKEFLRVNDDELELILKQLTAEEVEILSSRTFSFSVLRKVIALRNKYLSCYS